MERHERLKIRSGVDLFYPNGMSSKVWDCGSVNAILELSCLGNGEIHILLRTVLECKFDIGQEVLEAKHNWVNVVGEQMGLDGFSVR